MESVISLPWEAPFARGASGRGIPACASRGTRGFPRARPPSGSADLLVPGLEVEEVLEGKDRRRRTRPASRTRRRRVGPWARRTASSRLASATASSASPGTTWFTRPSRSASLGVDEIAEEEELEGLRGVRPDRGAAAEAPPSGPSPMLREDHTEARSLRGDAQVRGQGQAAADAHGVAVDAADDRLRKRPQAADAAVPAVEDVAPGVAGEGGGFGAATLLPGDGLQVGTRREAAAGSGQDDRPHGVVRLHLEEHALHLEEETGGQRVARRGSVHGERRHAALPLEEEGGLRVRLAGVRHGMPPALTGGSPAGA